MRTRTYIHTNTPHNANLLRKELEEVVAEICLTFSIQVLGQARWSRNSLTRCKTQLTSKISEGLTGNAFTLPTLPQRYSRGGNWSIRESVLIAATNSGSSLHLLDHSALVYRMFCSVVQEKSMIFYTIELPFSLYDQIYVYFVPYTDIRIFLHVFLFHVYCQC